MKLYLLGPPRLQIDEDVQLLNGTNTAVLAQLALSKQTQFQLSRSRLAGTIWPETSEEHARQLLSNALYRLKRLFTQHPTYLQIDNETVGLHHLWIDIWAFAKMQGSNDLHQWQSAIELYGGDLLEGHDPLWILPQRAALREQFLQLLARTIAQYETIGELEKALLTANRWTIADPLNEAAHRTAMSLYARLGRYAIALQQYDKLAALLEQELNVEPLPETQELYALLKTERQKTAVSPTTLPFVGRHQERQQLLGQLEQLGRGKGGVVLLEGDAGMGKTRLLTEIAQSAAWRDFEVARGWAAEQTLQSPYAPLPSLLRELLRPLWIEQLAPELSLSVKRLLAHWVPALRRQLPDAALLPTTDGKFKPTPVRLAVGKVLALLGERTAGVLILDDLHWAGEAFWELLPALLRLCEERPFLIILSYRPRPVHANEVAWQTLQSIEQAHTPLRIQLAGLEREACRALMAQLGKPDDDALLDQLLLMSNGNPLFLKEAILEQTAVSFERILAERIGALSQTAVRALTVAAVLGREFSFTIWQLCVGEPIPLAELLHSRLLRETKGGIAFDHDLVRAYIVDALPDAERRQWHERVARTLPLENQRLGEIAWHFEQAEAWQKAIYFYHRAADFAYHVEDVGAAVLFCERGVALTAVSPTDPQLRLALDLLQLQLIPTVMLTEADGNRIHALAQAAAESENLDLILKAQTLTAKYLTQQGKINDVEIVIDQMLEMVGQALDKQEAIKTLSFLSYQLAAYVRNTQKGIAVANRAIERAKAHPQQPHLLVNAIFMRVLNYLYQRDLEDIDDDLHWAKRLIEQHPELNPLRGELLYYQAIRAQLGGDWEAARAKQHQLIEQHRRSQNINELLGALYNGCNVAMFTCQFDEAVMLAEELLALVNKHVSEPDFYYLYLYQAMAIEAYSANRQFDEANQITAPLLRWAERAGEGVAKARVFSAVAVLRIDEGNYEAAYQLAHQILAVEKYESTLTMRSYLLLAECAFKTGRQAEGEQVLARAREKRKPGNISSSTVYFFFVSYLAEPKVSLLCQTYEVMLSIAEGFKSKHMRRDYLHGSPFHTELFAAFANYPAHFKQVYLSPIGVDAVTADKIKVWWLVDNGERDADLLATKGKVALRRRRLERLVKQARTYGAAPTLAELADALGVTVRTVERDNQALTAQGRPLATWGAK